MQDTMPGDEALSEAEMAYFSSGGKETSGLALDKPATATPEPAGGETAPKATDAPATKGAAPEAANEPGEDDGEEVIITGKDGKPRGTNGRFVPHQALHSERERRKGVEAELAREREKATRLDERWKTLEQLAGAPDPKAASAGKMAAEANPYDEADIDPAEDIFKALDQQKRRNAFLRQRLEKTESDTSARDAATTLRQTYTADARRLVAEQISKGEVVEVDGQKVAAFQAAYGFLVAFRHAQLEATGITDKATRDRIIAKEEGDLVQTAIGAGQKPADVIFAFAKASGYKGASPANTKANDENAAKLAAVKNGMTASASLSGTGGGADQLTPARIADMSEEEFNAWSSKQSKETLRRLMGG